MSKYCIQQFRTALKHHSNILANSSLYHLTITMKLFSGFISQKH